MALALVNAATAAALLGLLLASCVPDLPPDEAPAASGGAGGQGPGGTSGKSGSGGSGAGSGGLSGAGQAGSGQAGSAQGGAGQGGAGQGGAGQGGAGQGGAGQGGAGQGGAGQAGGGQAGSDQAGAGQGGAGLGGTGEGGAGQAGGGQAGSEQAGGGQAGGGQAGGGQAGSEQAGGGQAGAGQAGEGGAGQAGGGAAGGGGSAGAASLVNGSACNVGAQCESGFCVDGVCCESACKGKCAACIGGLTGSASGVCAPVKPETDPDEECPEDAAQCLAGVCDGNGACGKVADGTLCRSAVDICDASEFCSAGQCPADAAQPTGKSCRASKGGCDVEDVCDGASFQCGPDALIPAGQPGDCGVYLCQGVAACPVSCVSNSDCTDAHVCSAGECKPFLRVFVTNTVAKGNFGGAIGADQICQTRAGAASLPGTYKAWVSDSSSTTTTRFTHSPIPYVNEGVAARVVIADSWADLVDGKIGAQILFNEYGDPRVSQPVWSGTTAGGLKTTPNCSEWTSATAGVLGKVGTNLKSDAQWSDTGNLDCSTPQAFYCFEQ